jgi:Na+/H+ antiporter NhaD/arsenite permease-like protein
MAELTHGSSVVYEQTSIAYDVIATIIFVIMSFCFFFPYNFLVPLDRRTAAAVAATCCYVTRAFLFPNKTMNLEAAVDFDVIILLSGIMIINYIVIHQKETKLVILYTQDKIYESPKYGFWLVSFAAFATSPFLTNDGVCLLFVEPILNAFDRIGDGTDTEEGGTNSNEMKLERGDAFYFLIALACATNTGSALTYTGNPQVK